MFYNNTKKFRYNWKVDTFLVLFYNPTGKLKKFCYNIYLSLNVGPWVVPLSLFRVQFFWCDEKVIENVCHFLVKAEKEYSLW